MVQATTSYGLKANFHLIMTRVGVTTNQVEAKQGQQESGRKNKYSSINTECIELGNITEKINGKKNKK